MEQRKSKFFYGWVVVIGLMFIQGAAVGILNNTLSVFTKPVTAELGITRTAFQMYNTFGRISGLAMGPLWGEFFRKRRYKPTMLAGCLLIAACMFSYSFATHVYHFYAIAAVKGIFNGALTGVPIALMLSNWFYEKRGVATGLALAGSGLAGSIMVPITSSTIAGLGWRFAFRQLGWVFLAITIPILIFVIKERPEDMGLKCYGIENKPAAPPSASGMKSGFSRAQALKSKTFYIYCAALALTQVCGMGIQNNIIPHLTDIGYSGDFAAIIFSAMMLILVPGKLVLGWIYDRFGMKTGTVFITVLLVASAVTIYLGANIMMVYAFALIFGFANAIQTMQLPYMTVRLMGEKELSRVYGVCQMFIGVGGAVGIPLTSLAYDLTGSYNVTFSVIAVCAVLVMGLLLTAIRLSPKEIAKWDREDGLIAAQPVTAAMN